MSEEIWHDLELDSDLVERMIKCGAAERVTIVRATPMLDEMLKLYQKKLNSQKPIELVKPINGIFYF